MYVSEDNGSFTVVVSSLLSVLFRLQYVRWVIRSHQIVQCRKLGYCTAASFDLGLWVRVCFVIRTRRRPDLETNRFSSI